MSSVMAEMGDAQRLTCDQRNHRGFDATGSGRNVCRAGDGRLVGSGAAIQFSKYSGQPSLVASAAAQWLARAPTPPKHPTITSPTTHGCGPRRVDNERPKFEGVIG